MSQMYAMAMQQGMQGLETMLSGGGAAFQHEYALQSRRFAQLNRKQTSIRNIAAIKQDKILTDKTIQIRQSQAEAMARVSAAAAGVSGGSVNDVIQMTHVNETQAMKMNERQAQQGVEQEKANVHSAFMGAMGEQSTKSSFGVDMLKAFAGVEGDELRAHGGEMYDKVRQLWSG